MCKSGTFLRVFLIPNKIASSELGACESSLFFYRPFIKKITIMTKEEVLKRAEAAGLTFEVKRELASGSTPDEAAREWDLL